MQTVQAKPIPDDLNGSVAIPTGGSFAVLLDGDYSTNDHSNTDSLSGTARPHLSRCQRCVRWLRVA